MLRTPTGNSILNIWHSCHQLPEATIHQLPEATNQQLPKATEPTVTKQLPKATNQKPRTTCGHSSIEMAPPGAPRRNRPKACSLTRPQFCVRSELCPRTHFQASAFGPPHSRGRTRLLTRPVTGGEGCMKGPRRIYRLVHHTFFLGGQLTLREGISLTTP